MVIYCLASNGLMDNNTHPVMHRIAPTTKNYPVSNTIELRSKNADLKSSSHAFKYDYQAIHPP